ncbi:MAG TPA: cupredoxin family copper-binding protein [Casimicrobiaceae bacterium]
MKSRTLLPTTLTSAVAAAIAVATFAIGAAAAEPRTVTVDITKFAFAPKEVTVVPGTKVVWTNHDDTPHTVAANDKTFVSKGLDTDDRFEFTFAKEGDYAYICTVHPFMTGVVHVKRP